MPETITLLNIFHSKIRLRKGDFAMKKSNSKVNVEVINFTQVVYNNLIVNVNADNSFIHKRNYLFFLSLTSS